MRIQETFKDLPCTLLFMHLWNKHPPSPASKHFGDQWVAAGSSLGLLVPSVIAMEERNLLLNPAHPRFREVRVIKKGRVRMDARLYDQ